LRAIICLPLSFTPKKALPKDWRFTEISYTGNLDFLFTFFDSL
jgi:hypothetical protein